MRHGYDDNEKLAEYVEATPRLARPIIETLTIEASDLKDTFDEFDAADSAGGLSAEFTIFDEGGCRLAGTGADELLSSDRSIDTSADITSLVPPTESPLGVAVVELGGVNTTGREIWGAKAFLDPNTGAGKEVEFWHCNLYQFEGVDINGNEEAWNLRYLASDRVEATATTAGDVGFSFSKGASVPIVGNPPDVSDPRIGIGLSIKGATVVMVIYALKSNGDIAENVSWRCNSGASSVTSGEHTIFRYNLTALDTPAEGSTLRYTATSVVGVPDMEFTANTSYSDATIEWVTTTNKLDLGQAPASGTDLELTLQTATPSDTSVTAQIYNDADATWYTFVDNDIIGEDRSSEDGSDLSAMTRQQSYKVKATLSTSTDTSHTPRLYRIGVQEVTSEVVDGLLDVTAASWAIDPITSQSEIPTMSLTLHRDGEKDYRSWADELFSTNQLNELLFRVWVGHPDLAKRYWLHIDDFIVGNYTPTEAGINVELLSPLQYALVEIPPKTGSSRAPVPYENATLKSVYDDIVTTQAAIQARYIGAGIKDETTSNNVTKTLAVEEQAVDVLRQLNYINGSATISSQGVLKVVSLFDGESPAPHANFPYDELTVLSTDTGFDRRITKFDVPYGWDGNKYTNEQVAKPPQDVLDRLGPIAMSQANQLDDGVARWLRTSGHADRIGSRMIENFLNGLSQIHFRSHTAKPWLEPGDAVAIESDVYVGIDPRNNRALRGRGWSKGIVTQCHDIMGHEFTVWVQSWYNVNASNTAFAWDAGMTPGGKVLYQPYDPVAEQTQALWRAEFGTQAITITAGAGLSGGGDLTANRTIAMSRYGFESLSDPDGGGDRLPFFDDSQDGFQWLTVGSGLSITDTTITATGTDFNAGTGLSESSNTFAIKYAAQASTPNADVGNLIDGAADSGDIASADLILYQRDSDGVVRKDTVSALPFTNNAGTVTSVAVGAGLSLTGVGSVNPTVALDRFGFEDLTAPGADKVPFYDYTQAQFDWLLFDTDDFTISATTISLAAGAVGLTDSGIGLEDSGGTVSIKYGAGSNIFDGCSTTDIAGADLILFQDSDGTVKRDTVANLPFTNNAGTVTSVSGTGTVSGLTLSGTVTASGDLELGGTLSVNESDIVDGTILARLAADETVSGTYSFSAAPRLNAGLDLQNESSEPSATAGYQMLYSYNNGSTFELRSHDGTNRRNIPLITGSAANDQLLVSTGTDHEADWSGTGLTWNGTTLTATNFSGNGSALTSVSADTSTVTDLTTQTATYYPIMADGTSGAVSHFVDASELSYTSSTDTLNLVSAVLSGDLTVDTSTLVVDSTNDRVGIATANPYSALDLGPHDGSQISWHTNSTTSYAHIWASRSGARLTLGHGVMGSTTVNNGFEYSTSNTWARSAIELSYGQINFFCNPADSGTYGNAVAMDNRMYLSTTGFKVDVGSDHFQIVRDSASTAQLELNNSSGDRGYLQATNAGAVTLATQVAGGQINLRDNGNGLNLIQADYNGTDTVRINSNGNNSFAINATGTTATSAIMRWRFGGTDEARIQWLDSSNELRVRLEDSTDRYSIFIGGASGPNDRRFDIKASADHTGVVAIENAQLYVDEYGTQYEDTGTVTIEWDKGNQQLIDFDSTSTTTTININDGDMEAGGSYILLLQYNSGSSQTIAWTSSIPLLWANGDEPTSTYTAGTAGDITVVQFFKTTVATDKIIGSYYIVT